MQHALRQALTADAQTLQFKLAPPGVPPPPTHVSAGVAAGAPVVEGLAVTSVWTVQLLKLLAQVGWARVECLGQAWHGAAGSHQQAQRAHHACRPCGVCGRRCMSA